MQHAIAVKIYKKKQSISFVISSFHPVYCLYFICYISF